MEEVQEASIEENIKNFDGLEEGASSTTVKGDEKMEKGMKNVPCMKRMEWHGRKCELVNYVGEIIIERRIVACDPREHVLDDDLCEIEVGVTILSCPKDTSQIMTILK